MNFLFKRFISPTPNRQFRRDNFDYGHSNQNLKKVFFVKEKKNILMPTFLKKSVVTFITAENKGLDKTLYQRRC